MTNKENMEKTMQSIDTIHKKQNIKTIKMEPIIENEIYCVKNQYIEMQKKCKKIFDNPKFYDVLHRAIKYMLSHPLLLVTVIIVTATLIVPILCFTIFAMINVAIIFNIFIIFEVTLLMIGLTVLCCVLFFITKAIVLTGLSFTLSFYIVYSSFSLVKRKLNYT